jgi:hypothetical protein
MDSVFSIADQFLIDARRWPLPNRAVTHTLALLVIVVLAPLVLDLREPALGSFWNRFRLHRNRRNVALVRDLATYPD